MLADILRRLRCPVCTRPLAEVPTGQPDPDRTATSALRCPVGHNFDLARQGYVNLTTGRVAHSGDTPAMVAARDEFLGAGHYDLISTALARMATALAGDRAATYPELVVDAGAGTGRHLGAVLDALPGATGLALDVSKPALRRAARAHPRAGAALCDTWQGLPLVDGAAGLLLNVFAPRNGAEFRRVLRPDGALLVVTPDADHLGELVERLDLLRVDPAKEARVAGSLAEHFGTGQAGVHRRTLRLTRNEVRTLVGMGPSAWHTDPARLDERIDALPEPVPVTAAVRVAVHHPR
ncbi:23S rRNA methyltransferase [Plantactinospora sp. S1510]|uniref:23S rRNA methyltransferase n=1 Tax=Plantactinospora alkalitolerans TaxID=2789879 RepID=A0ABS0GU78_9ACTN|nr:23S rRNA methyltransferase [Plantactinospora alkalitolerans]MBF9129768.1 23S rRNA methyltransferase [Plantactinospora alkalitolerans]